MYRRRYVLRSGSNDVESSWKLPVAWYIERNNYAISTKVSDVIGTVDLADRGKGFGIPGASYSGDDICLVREVMREAIEKARKGEPTISEFRTYRWRGHFVGDPATYRDPAELKEAQEKHDQEHCNDGGPVRSLNHSNP